MRSLLISLGAMLIAGQAYAQQPPAMPDFGSFTPFVQSTSCTPLSVIEKVAKKMVPMKSEAMRFVQGLYVATPPLSTKLPPGDKLVIALNDKIAMAVITDGKMACIKFPLPLPMLAMVIGVDKGDKTHAGEDM